MFTELDVEKNAELTRYKRRLAKLRDQTNQLMNRYTDMGSADAKTNIKITNGVHVKSREHVQNQQRLDTLLPFISRTQ